MSFLKFVFVAVLLVLGLTAQAESDDFGGRPIDKMPGVCDWQNDFECRERLLRRGKKLPMWVIRGQEGGGRGNREFQPFVDDHNVNPGMESVKFYLDQSGRRLNQRQWRWSIGQEGGGLSTTADLRRVVPQGRTEAQAICPDGACGSRNPWIGELQRTKVIGKDTRALPQGVHAERAKAVGHMVCAKKINGSWTVWKTSMTLLGTRDVVAGVAHAFYATDKQGNFITKFENPKKECRFRQYHPDGTIRFETRIEQIQRHSDENGREIPLGTETDQTDWAVVKLSNPSPDRPLAFMSVALKKFTGTYQVSMLALHHDIKHLRRSVQFSSGLLYRGTVDGLDVLLHEADTNGIASGAGLAFNKGSKITPDWVIFALHVRGNPEGDNNVALPISGKLKEALRDFTGL